MLLIIVLTGTVFPVFENIVQAKDDTSAIVETFNIDESKTPWRLNDANLRITDPSDIGGVPTVTSTQALLSLDLKMNTGVDGTFAADDVNKNGYFDNDDNPNGWDSVIGGTSNSPETAACRGIFLTISKLKDPTKPPTDDNLENVDTDEFNVPLPPSDKIVQHYKDKYAGDSSVKKFKWSAFQLSCFTNAQQIFATNSRANIGLYFWGMKDDTGANNFFKKIKWNNIKIPVTGLKPNTKYYVNIEVKEDNVDLSTLYLLPGFIGKTVIGPHRAVSNGVIISTLTTDPTNAIDLGGAGSTDEVVNDDDNTRIEDGYMDCSFKVFNSDSESDSIGKCIAKVYYRWMTAIGGVVLMVAGNIFDAFLAISIGSSMYNTDKAAFVYEGWRICRDLANIFFIFILLYTAIGTILGLHSVNYKKIVTQVILVAIFINFSMFMCRVIIDTGNILARVFYNEVSLTGTTDQGYTKGDVKEKDISSGLVNGINPQKLFLNTRDEQEVKQTSAVSMFIMGTIIFILLIAIAWALFMSGAYFVGRIGVLWVSMIFAPLAFVSTLIPSLGKKFGQIGWSSWFSSLTTAAFNAPIFMFFIYLILLLSKQLGTIMPMVEAADNPVEKITVVALPIMIIMGLLTQAKSIAKEMAGQFGEVADGAFKGALGLGAMAVTGGVAALGAKTFGANAMRTLNDQNLKNVAAGNMEGARAHGFTGTTTEEFEKWKATQAGTDFKKKSEDAQKKLLSAKKMSERSFDMRQIPGMSAVSKGLGVNMNTGSGLAKMAGLEFSSGARAGGARAEADRRIAKDDKKKKDMEEVLKGDPAEIHHKKEQKEELESEKKKAEEAKTEVEERNKPLVEAAEKAEKDANFAVQQEKDRTGRVSQATLDRQKTAKDAADNARSVQTAELKPFNEKIKAIEKGGTYTENGQTFTVNFKDSIKGLDKDINYAEKGRAREYFKNKADDAHHARDTYGNALSMNALGATLKGVLRDGLIGFAVGGPLGALAGSVVGASRENGAVLNRLIGVFENTNRTLLGLGHTNFSGRAQSYEEDQLKSDPHYHAKSFKDDYKSPNKDFFKMFEGLGGGGGHGGGDHGGGHDDHGHGGHDDHGGGDHGGGHH